MRKAACNPVNTVDDPAVSSSLDVERSSCRKAESAAVIESWNGCNTDGMFGRKKDLIDNAPIRLIYSRAVTIAAIIPALRVRSN